MTDLLETRNLALRRILTWASVVTIFAGFVWYVLPYLMFATLVLVGGAKSRQLEQLESPDHFAQAILVQTRPALATEPFGLRIYIRRSGTSQRLYNPVMEAVGLQNLAIIWIAPRVLQISYSSGCVGSFHNSWLALDPDGHPYTDGNRNPYSVEIRLKPPSDPAPHTCD